MARPRDPSGNLGPSSSSGGSMARTIARADGAPSTLPDEAGAGGPPVPGLVLVFSGRAPLFSAIPLPRGGVLIERRGIGSIPLTDGAISRSHARVDFDGERWHITDLDSRNGTFVDGRRVHGELVVAEPAVVRAGTSLLLLLRDGRRCFGGRMDLGALVRGPTLQGVHELVADAARVDGVLHLTGESGVGKDVAARLFHDSGPHASGPFVAVNCAAIPAGLAERLLFGARKGAFSGATADSEGYLQAADGGTLFLDEVAELEAGVQAKLLRVIETREVLPLGASRPRPVRLRICSATHQGLRALVAAGRFREDLYYRLGRPEVLVPPLRERREEIPFLVQRALGELDPRLSARPSFVESCLARRWPGNVRELWTETRDAGRAALRAGETEVEESRLPAAAGLTLGNGEVVAAPPGGHARRGAPEGAAPSRARVESVLASAGGNVSRAAVALGLHRTELRRVIERFGIDLDRYRAVPGGLSIEETVDADSGPL